jgi:hypothetical protein
MTEQEKIIDYYKVGYSQNNGYGSWPKPRFIPKRVSVTKTVTSDFPFFLPGPHPVCHPGEYDVECNAYGAVSVVLPEGKLGLKLDEFDIIEMTENPKYEEASS